MSEGHDTSIPDRILAVGEEKDISADVVATMHRALLDEGHEPGELIYEDIIDLEMQSYVRLRAVEFGAAGVVRQQILDHAAALCPTDWTGRMAVVEEEMESFSTLQAAGAGDVKQAYLEQLKDRSALWFSGGSSGQQSHILTVAPQRGATNRTSITQYLFPWPDERKGYRVFPEAMENNELVAFHGTARANLDSIINDGFKFAESLQSLSFAKQSLSSLSHACGRRSETSPEGVVIAVRFAPPIPRLYVAVEISDIHVYSLDEQPEVIGYCIVPADYILR